MYRGGTARHGVTRSEVRESVGARIIWYRAARCISFRELSDLSGIPEIMLGRIERGDMRLTFENMLCIARGLGVPVTELRGRRVEPGLAPGHAPGVAAHRARGVVAQAQVTLMQIHRHTLGPAAVVRGVHLQDVQALSCHETAPLISRSIRSPAQSRISIRGIWYGSVARRTTP